MPQSQQDKRLKALQKYEAFLQWSIDHPNEADLTEPMLQDYKTTLSDVQREIDTLK